MATHEEEEEEGLAPDAVVRQVPTGNVTLVHDVPAADLDITMRPGTRRVFAGAIRLP